MTAPADPIDRLVSALKEQVGPCEEVEAVTFDWTSSSFVRLNVTWRRSDRPTRHAARPAVVAAVQQLWNAAADDGEPWVAMRAVLRRDGRLSVDFDYADPRRWSG